MSLQIDEARGIAAKTWTKYNLRRRVMDPDVCEAFAEILVEQSQLDNLDKPKETTKEDVIAYFKSKNINIYENITKIIHEDFATCDDANLYSLHSHCEELAKKILEGAFQ